MLPTYFTNLCPGIPGPLRHFRVIAADWEDAWSLIEKLYRAFGAQWEPGYTWANAHLRILWYSFPPSV